jgi:hypothetical protein
MTRGVRAALGRMRSGRAAGRRITRALGLWQPKSRGDQGVADVAGVGDR